MNQETLPTHLSLALTWCESLGLLTAVSTSNDEAVLKVTAYAPLLADRFPAEAFTRRSLEHCAAASPRGFPTYGELVGVLGTWWRDHRPPFTALPAPPPAARTPPTPEERAAVARSLAELAGSMRANLPSEPEDRPITAKHLSAEQLDKLNPLPNGRRRAG